MLLGYMRVSKLDGSQVLDLQRDALVGAGVDPRYLYEDLGSGRHDDRPGLVTCLKALRTGDNLVVWRLDRLGRDLRHLVNTVHDLTLRGVGLTVLTGHGAAIDTTTASGKLVFGIFAALAEFERDLELDLAVSMSNQGRFRANLYYQRGEVAMVVRLIKSEIPDFEHLGLPKMLEKLAMQDRGLIPLPADRLAAQRAIGQAMTPMQRPAK